MLPALQGTVRIASLHLKLHFPLHVTNSKPISGSSFIFRLPPHNSANRRKGINRLLFILTYYRIFHGFLLQYLEKSLYSLVYEQSSGFV